LSGDKVNADTSKEQEAAKAVNELVREMKEGTSGNDKKLYATVLTAKFLQ